MVIDNFNIENRKFKGRFARSLKSSSILCKWSWVPYRNLETPDIYAKILASDGVILSGSYLMASDPETQNKYQKVIDLIHQYEKPLLGICFGHQLIGVAFNGEIKNLTHSDYNIEDEVALDLTFQTKFPLINKNQIKIYLNHHQEISCSPQITDQFHIYASTPNCSIQAMKHKQKPIFGVQFHPENPKNIQAFQDGEKILKNFVKML